ncbi:MAG: N-acetyltransferase family protein [Acutalibacteraceae bacterium]
MDKQVKLRIATVQDAAALLDIYAPYVENTAITFEYTVPSVWEFEHRISILCVPIHIWLPKWTTKL